MPVDFLLPDLGENITKADIGRVLVSEGDVIDAEQVVLELETEKAVFELPCPHGGKVTAVHVKDGQTIEVGAKVLTLDQKRSEATSTSKTTEDKKLAKDKEDDEPVKEPAASEKAEAGKSARPVAEERASKPAARRPDAAAHVETTPATPVAEPPDGDRDRPPAPAGPATRRLARELGIDLYRVRGTAAGGRITQDDVKSFVRGLTRSTPVSQVQAPPTLPDFSQWGPIERRPLSKIGRVSAQRLSIAWQHVPHVTQHELADITELEAARGRFMQGEGKNGPKITMTVLAMRAAVRALERFPHFNASYDADRGEIILKKHYHIGIAVDTEHGLMVPVIRNVDQKSLLELADELTKLAERARDRKLSLDQMQGGTFTITNLGGIGGTAFTPIVNFPEVAILGMSRTQKQVALVDGYPQNRLMLPLSLSYDHRVINGADGIRFARAVADLLADPFSLLAT